MIIAKRDHHKKDALKLPVIDVLQGLFMCPLTIGSEFAII